MSLTLASDNRPFVLAAAVYEREWCARTLAEDLEAHLLYGWVMSSAEVFLMGRRVRHGWPVEWMCDPYVTAEDGDCWHVWLCGGSVVSALAAMPFPLEWVSFERENELRVMRMERLMRLAGVR